MDFMKKYLTQLADLNLVEIKFVFFSLIKRTTYTNDDGKY